MDGVTVHAGQLALVVRAPVPQRRTAARVALQADRVAVPCRHGLREVHQTADITASTARDVIRCGTVTTLASEARPGAPRVSAMAMRLIHVAHELVVVALCTRVR